MKATVTINLTKLQLKVLMVLKKANRSMTGYEVTRAVDSTSARQTLESLRKLGLVRVRTGKVTRGVNRTKYWRAR